jgi:hypothetical protein
MEEKDKEKKGVAIKFFGMSLILLGSLNMVFYWRGGFPMSPLHPIVMGVGIALFIFGGLRGKQGL